MPYRYVAVLHVPPYCVTKYMSPLPAQDSIYNMRVYTGGLPCLRVHQPANIFRACRYCIAKKTTALALALYYIG